MVPVIPGIIWVQNIPALVPILCSQSLTQKKGPTCGSLAKRAEPLNLPSRPRCGDRGVAISFTSPRGSTLVKLASRCSHCCQAVQKPLEACRRFA